MGSTHAAAPWQKIDKKRNRIAVGPTAILKKMAEGKGFEPLWDCSQTVFKTASL